MSEGFDAIVIGARCAGSPTAMLLAQKGHRVLVVDRATFPSDTISSHIVQPRAAAVLARWGLLDRLAATGCPPIRRMLFDFGPLTFSGSQCTPDAPVAYCARRTVLDKILVDAAAEAGAEIREGIVVEGLIEEGGRVTGIKGRTTKGQAVTERAKVVVGADGWHSTVVDVVRPERYHEQPPLLAAYYSYWSGLPVDGQVEFHIRPTGGFGAAPTHDGLTMIIGGWPAAEFAAKKSDVDGHFLKMLDLAPEFAERARSAKREAKYSGALLPGYFHKPYGPGWALVGDAGYVKDSITAQGINDAFHDAERCAIALDASLTGARPFDDAMAGYQRDRDAHAMPMFEMTCQLARNDPPTPEMLQLLAGMQGNQEALDGFAQMNAGTIPAAQFFGSPSIQAIMSRRA